MPWRAVPQLAPLIGFYNAGLARAERKRIEELFRTDALSVLVATSAFGEGVDIPNIRHVVLYHLPLEAIIGMYQEILGSIADVPTGNALLNCLMVFNVPFTLCKGILDVALCFLIYKPLSPLLHK